MGFYLKERNEFLEVGAKMKAVINGKKYIFTLEYCPNGSCKQILNCEGIGEFREWNGYVYFLWKGSREMKLIKLVDFTNLRFIHSLIQLFEGCKENVLTININTYKQIIKFIPKVNAFSDFKESSTKNLRVINAFLGKEEE